MHLLAGTDDGIDRAGLYALGAADAQLFIDQCHGWQVTGMFIGQGFRFTAEGFRQHRDGIAAARHTQIELGLTADQCLGIGAAARVTALSALCLW